MADTPKDKRQFILSKSTLPMFNRASQLFLNLSLEIQGAVSTDGSSYDQSITELQRMREFLLVVEKMANQINEYSPVTILDLLSKKELGNIVLRMQAIFFCTIASHTMQEMLRQCFSSISSQQPADAIKIDRKHLH